VHFTGVLRQHACNSKTDNHGKFLFGVLKSPITQGAALRTVKVGDHKVKRNMS